MVFAEFAGGEIEGAEGNAAKNITGDGKLRDMGL
jgi:hypothetical protein